MFVEGIQGLVLFQDELGHMYLYFSLLLKMGGPAAMR